MNISSIGPKNYLGETILRDSYGNQIGTIGHQNHMTGDTPIRNQYGQTVGTIGPENYLGERPVRWN